MALFDIPSMDWTPAACFVAFQSTLLVLTALAFVTGSTDGIYKMEPHTKKMSMGRRWEILEGGHLLHWGSGMIGALIAGGAQEMCILGLPGVLACTYCHYASGEASGKKSATINLVFMAAMAYFGFVPMPTTPSIEWTPAACVQIFQATLMWVYAFMFLWGPPDAYYKASPHVKELMCRHGELALGGCLLGMGGGLAAAVIAGGAQRMCIIQLPGLAVCTYMHFTGQGGMKDGITNTILMLILAYVGFAS